MTIRILDGVPIPEDVRTEHAALLVFYNEMSFFQAIKKLKVRFNPLKRAVKALRS